VGRRVLTGTLRKAWYYVPPQEPSAMIDPPWRRPVKGVRKCELGRSAGIGRCVKAMNQELA